MIRSPVLLLITLVAVAFPGCRKPPEVSDVWGKYAGTIHGAVESLELRADGSYSQTLSLPSGGDLTTSGAWHLERSVVYLDGYLSFYDSFKEGTLRTPRKTNNVGFELASDMLIDDWGSGFYTLQKQSNSES